MYYKTFMEGIPVKDGYYIFALSEKEALIELFNFMRKENISIPNQIEIKIEEMTSFKRTPSDQER